MSEPEAEKIVDEVDWEKSELIPVITQDKNGEVLTLAYMNKRALSKTIKTGSAHYYSRSKERIRMKGEVSGNVQDVEEVKMDCDRDALLMKVDQKGQACHKGFYSCFYRSLSDPNGNEEQKEGIDYSLSVLKELEEVIKNRKENPIESSYTASLFSDGEEEIDKKLGEESIEVLIAENKERMISESADLLYHLLVKLISEDIELRDVMKELSERRVSE